MSQRKRRANVLKLEKSGDHQLRHRPRPEGMKPEALDVARKKGWCGEEREKNRPTQPDRGVQDANEADGQNHGVTLRKTGRKCQEGNGGGRSS
jgi:hypothetical protein